MKKIVTTIILIILLTVEILTPISYAVDNEGIVAEEPVIDFEEEKTELDVIENEEEELIGNEDEETEEKNIDNQEEGDLGEEIEVFSGDNIDNGEDRAIPEEVSELGTGRAKDILEITTGDISETYKTGVNDNNQDFEEENYSLSEEENREMKEKDGNVTGNNEGLIGTNNQLTGEILTGKEEKNEIGIAREKLNNQPITGTDKTKSVIVDVEAPVGTFPQGTELRIEPITKTKKLNQIREQIIDVDDTVEDDAVVVAFDISFIYTLISGEEVELQPSSGNTVKVSFNYEGNRKLVNADKDGTQEVIVLHIEDKDENGEKVEKGEEIVSEIKAEPQASKNEGEIVVQAESFSIYSVTVGGTRYDIEWDDYVGTTTLEGNGGSTYNYFSYGTLTIGNTTIMDRNLGATDVWTYTDSWSTLSEANIPGTYGYYYQFGNNYGFKPGITPTIGTYQYESTSASTYSSNIWMTGPEWNSAMGLWGGWGTQEERKGPCPTGWHVPAGYEWEKLYNALGSSKDAKGFAKSLKLPPAGLRDSSLEFDYVGVYGFYWANEIGSIGGEVLEFFATSSNSNVHANDSSFVQYRSYGAPVRCFMNSYSKSLTFNATENGGTTTLSSIEENEGTTINLSDLTSYSAEKEGYDFVGWNTDPTAHEGLTSIELNEDTEVYAIFSKTVEATFSKNGATSIGSNSLHCTMWNNENSCPITAPSITRTNWTIKGWNTNANATSALVEVGGTITLTSNVQYYAITSKLYYAYFYANGATSIGYNSLSCRRWNTRTSCTVTAPSITRDGREILGWNTNANATSVSLEVGGTITLTSNNYYYAITSKQYIATFNTNGATSIGSNSLPCTMWNNGESCTVTAPSITRDGREILGWDTNANATSASVEVGGTITLAANASFYAITKKECTANFMLLDPNAATLSSSISSGTAYNQGSCNISAPTLIPYNGYEAFGWSSIWGATENNLTTTFEAGNTYYSVTRNSTPFTVTYIIQDENAVIKEGGDTGCYRYNGLTGCGVLLPTLIAKSGYTALGWSTDSNAIEADYDSNSSSPIKGNVTYYSVTKNNTPITITFNVNGNKGDNSSLTCYKYNGSGSCSITSPNITPANGFTEIGWSIATGTYVNQWTGGTSKLVSDDAEYFAQSEKKGYLVNLTYNSSTGVSMISSTSDTCSVGTVYNGATQLGCSKSAPTITCLTGYTNPKWNTSLSSGVLTDTTYTATCDDIDEPKCSISIQPSITGMSLIDGYNQGLVTFTCSDEAGISTNDLSPTVLIYDSNIVTIASNAEVGGNKTNRTYTFSYTAKAEGSTNFKLKAGVVSDDVGNTNLETAVSNTVIVDTTEPIITITQNNKDKWQQIKTITADGGDGQLTMYISKDATCNKDLNFITYEPKTFISENDNGTYICYKSVDNVGNTAFKVSSVVEKIDTTAPMLTDQTTYTTSWYTEDQDSIFTYTDTGAGINEGNNIASCIITEEGLTSTCNVVPNICDKAGNCNTLKQVSNPIKLDKTAPILKNQTTYEDGWYTTDQMSEFVYEDDVSGINGNTTISCAITNEGSNATCSVENTNICNNAGLCNTTSVTSNSIKLDKANPTCKISGNPTQWTNQNVVLTVSYDVEENKIAEGYSWDNQNYSNNQTLEININGVYTAYVKDVIGNTGSCSVEVTKIDKVLPIISINNPETTPARSKTIEASTNKGTLYMSEGKDSSCGEWRNFVSYTSVTYSSEEDNGRYVCYKAIDEAGNISYKSSTEIKGIDTTGPNVLFNDIVGVGPVKEHNIVVDWGDSIIKKWKYSENQSCSNDKNDYPYSDTDSMNVVNENYNGKYICIYAEDVVGNISTITSTNPINIDTTNPECEIAGVPTQRLNTTSTLTVSMIDSNVDENGYSWDDEEHYGLAIPKIINGNGIYTAYVKDLAGNTGSCSVNVTMFDNNAPQSNVTTTENLKSSTQIATLTCSDSVNVSSYYWGHSSTPAPEEYTAIQDKNTTFETQKTVSSTGTYYFYCKDEAGNASDVVSQRYKGYIVHSLLNYTNKETGIYNSTNYEEVGNQIYLLPEGISLTLDDVFTIPTNSTGDSYIGYTTSPTGTPIKGNTTLTEDTAYYLWFDRTENTLRLIIGNGIQTIYYKLNDAENYQPLSETTNIPVKAGSNIIFYAVAKNGYTHTSTNELSPEELTNIIENKEITLSAILNTYEIHYELDGGTQVNPKIMYTVEDEDFTLVNPTKDNHIFAGWTGSNGNELQTNVIITKGSVYEPLTYYANWYEDKNHNGQNDADEPKYTVKYTDGVEGDIIFPDQTTQYILSGTKTPEFKGSTNRINYVFVGWLPEVTEKVTRDITYIAQWKNDVNNNGIADEEETYTLTINYVYSRGGEAAPTYTSRVLQGESYYVSSPNVNNYQTTDETVLGTMPNNDKTITVTYTPITDDNHNDVADEEEQDDFHTLTIHYHTTKGGEVYPDYEKNIVKGASYRILTNEKTNYIIEDGKEVIEGVMGDANIEITVIYRTKTPDTNSNGIADEDEPKYTLTIQYKNTHEGQITGDYIAEYVAGAPYNVSSPITGHYTADPLVVNGIMPTDNHIETVIYTPDVDRNDNGIADFNEQHYTLTIHYKNAKNGKLYDDYIGSYVAGEEYEVSSSTSDSNYNIESGKEIVTGTMPAEDVEITVIYTAKIDANGNGIADEVEPHHTLTIHYINTKGATLFDDYVESIVEGGSYLIESEEKDHYTIDKPIVSGTMGEENIEITVIYSTLTEDTNDNGIADEEEIPHTLTIYYVYSRGEQASETITLNYLSGIRYSITIPLITNYTPNYQKVEGIMQDKDKEVTVKYRPNEDRNDNGYPDIMEPKYKVVVHYVYSGGGEAYADNIELDILSGLTYTITSPTIQYYEPNKPIVTGKIEGNDVEETVIYTPNQDKNLNGIADEVEPKYTVKYTDGVEGSIVFRDQTSIGLLSGLETPKFEGRIARKDYIFSGWVPKVEEKVYKNATYTATWKEDENNNGIDDITEEKYKITIKDGEIVLAIIELIPGMVIKLPELPGKNGYAFDGWEGLPKDGKSINKDLEITARRKKIQENSNSTGGGGGGGGSKNEEEHHSAPNTGEDKKIDLPFIIEKLKENVLDRWLNPINTNNNSSNSNEKEIEINTGDSSLINHELAPSNGRKSSYGSTLDEIKAAYEWAYSKDITTKKSIEEANPEGPLYRQHMAKMMVNFAANELGMEIPDETPRDCKWLDGSEAYESKEMEEYAVKACKLGLMGINIEYFNPGVVTTRAQFGTILSRLLFGFTYEGGDPYYKNHLEALKIRGIMTKIDNPKDRVELREWVRVMLMRVKDYKENLK